MAQEGGAAGTDPEPWGPCLQRSLCPEARPTYPCPPRPTFPTHGGDQMVFRPSSSAVCLPAQVSLKSLLPCLPYTPWKATPFSS